MNFKLSLYGFKTFKENAKEIFDFRDFLAIIGLFFSLGLMASRLSKKIKSVIMLFSLLAAFPAIIKTFVAILAGICEYKKG